MDHPRRRVVIMGAAGRDFHNFLQLYRNDATVEVIAFTAAQIPGISQRRFPASLAGPHYPEGIPIIDEQFLDQLIARYHIDEAVFSYSDMSHAEVMHTASRVLAAGAAFTLPGPQHTMLAAARPVIAVSAVRTGCGKSQLTRWLVKLLAQQGLSSAVIRHPMPYGDLEAQRAQRFASPADLQTAHCTIEEREEYEPHIEQGAVVFAGVDYAEVLALAERECQVLLWDGGNNDFPFLCPDLHIVLLDALRPGHEHTHHPGEAVLRMADVALIAKSECADASLLAELEHSIRTLNPGASIVHGRSPVTLEQPESIRGKRVLVVEDGPTITHGGMATGAGWRAAQDAGALIVDPRPWAVGELAQAYRRYPHIGPVLPALGYFAQQLQDLRATLEASDVEAIVCGTPIDLATLLQPDKPVVRARYEYADPEHSGLRGTVLDFLRERGL